MPNPGADRPLRKVTLNLYEDDCVKLEQMIGAGWTIRVREVVQGYCEQVEIVVLKRRRFLGDLHE